MWCECCKCFAGRRPPKPYSENKWKKIFSWPPPKKPLKTYFATNWSKTIICGLSSGQNNLPPPIWDHHPVLFFLYPNDREIYYSNVLFPNGLDVWVNVRAILCNLLWQCTVCWRLWFGSRPALLAPAWEYSIILLWPCIAFQYYWMFIGLWNIIPSIFCQRTLHIHQVHSK